MKIKNIIHEDFQNYKKISMFIGTSQCDWKCCLEQGLDVSLCQNSQLAREPNIDIPIYRLVDIYLDDKISNSIVFGGLEPMKQIDDILEFLSFLRNIKHCNDDVVIYTGYYENELEYELEMLKTYENIIVKFGRYIPNHEKHYDDVLGVYLASDNQYSKKIS